MATDLEEEAAATGYINAQVYIILESESVCGIRERSQIPMIRSKFTQQDTTKCE